MISVKQESDGKMCIDLTIPGRYIEYWEIESTDSSTTPGLKIDADSALNLYLAKSLLKEMDGKIVKGSNYIKLITPYIQAKKEESEAESVSHSEYSEMKVLIADDSSTCRKVLQQQCKLLDLSVDEAEDGMTALAMIRTASYLERPYDVVIVDHQMPGLNGIQIAERISANRKSVKMPSFIMLTGVTTPPNEVEIRNFGISSVLTKPVTRFTAQRTLTKVLEKDLPT